MRELGKTSTVAREDKSSGVGELAGSPGIGPGAAQAAPVDGFRATIECAGLWDLVQMTCGSRVRCAACVRSGMRSGYLYFGDGQIAHAEVGDLQGEAAALEILSWRQGTWQSSDVPWPAASASITTPWQGLLLRAAQREDEAGGRSHGPAVRDGSGASYRPADFEHAVRIDPHGAVIAGHGRPEELAALAAYVCRVGDVIGTLLGAGKVVALDGALAQGVGCLIFRKASGDTIALRPRAGVDLGLLRTQLQL